MFYTKVESTCIYVRRIWFNAWQLEVCRTRPVAPARWSMNSDYLRKLQLIFTARVSLVLELESRPRCDFEFIDKTKKGSQFDASRRGRKERKSSRDENARHQPYVVGRGRKSLLWEPWSELRLPYSYIHWRRDKRRANGGKKKETKSVSGA